MPKLARSCILFLKICLYRTYSKKKKRYKLYCENPFSRNNNFARGKKCNCILISLQNLIQIFRPLYFRRAEKYLSCETRKLYNIRGRRMRVLKTKHKWSSCCVFCFSVFLYIKETSLFLPSTTPPFIVYMKELCSACTRYFNLNSFLFSWLSSTTHLL